MQLKRLAQDMSHYLPLAGIFFAGILGFIMFSYDKFFQLSIVAATASGYFAWGIIHHHIHKDLSLVVMIEYLVISVLGVVIVFSLIFQA